MSSVRQLQANRLNAVRSTGPRTAEGKDRSRCNAVRHGLTAETVIAHLEHAEDYHAFEEAVANGYAPITAVDRELVLRLASVLWRLRRANLIECQLFNAEAEKVHSAHDEAPPGAEPSIADLFLRMLDLPNKPVDRLSRYEAMLWRQARQILAQLHAPERRKFSRHNQIPF